MLNKTRLHSQYSSSVTIQKAASINRLSLYSFYIIGVSLFLRLIFMGANELLAEEAYYWNYAKHLDFGYLDHPPMVAILIKLSTFIFSSDEFFVRLSSILCWSLTAFFNFKLANLIKLGSGIYAVMLLAVLPFFFLQSLVMTPDQPLLACWAAAIYYLFRSLILNEAKSWYLAGIWIGLGMLSKYTIVLLAPAILIYILTSPSLYYWFFRKEPYYCLVISLSLFIPVIYWNATHNWISFTFQSTRRFKSNFSFSLHEYLGLLFFFLTPIGLRGLYSLCKNTNFKLKKEQYFLQIFTLIPLLFFGFFSLTHEVKFNWIGPSLLALNPWLAKNMYEAINAKQYKAWFSTAIILLIFYASTMFVVLSGNFQFFNQKLFKKFISWRNLTLQIYQIAQSVENTNHLTPLLVSLDLYNLNSELIYYQQKLVDKKLISKSYPVEGRHIFGGTSLMYYYWSTNQSLAGKLVILIATKRHYFDNPFIKYKSIAHSPINCIWTYNQGGRLQVKPYYYQLVQLIN
ncbi:glycosyltransferase family 39 protein (plasmid) [Legionella sp. D16C41]|uniref:glycosyltransferase family 39 protein n=1 Tax=Legionella sp. D16C41 TaxID=3402688 RepID=UPI003AF9275C